MNVTIWHNPRCSKSRQTLELLRDRNLKPVIVEYLEHPPSEKSLRQVLGLLGLKPREFMRTGETEYSDNGLSNPALTDDELIAAMLRMPRLIERPVVLANGKAAVGRPPESVLEIL